MVEYPNLANTFYYATSLSLFTPWAIGHNYARVKQLPTPRPGPILRATITTAPSQIALRALQYNTASYVSEKTNPWLGFVTLGFFQGMIYGQATQYWSKTSFLRSTPFRGIPFAIARDLISQGLPYHFTPKDKGLNYLLPINVAAIFASQSLHNLQLIHQSNHSFTYYNTIKKLCDYKLFYRGVKSRLGLLTITNLVNYYCLDW